MDNKKKTRLFVRILCAILAVIMTLSIVLPVAYATEVESETEAPYLNGDGFEYVENDGEWYLNATGDKPVVRLTNIPEAFVRDNMPVLIANVDTFKVHIVNLLEVYGYAAALDIEEGYYLVATSNYCWADTNDNKWVINDAQTMYFYYGDTENFDSKKYNLDFVAEDNIVALPLTQYTENVLPVVRARGTFHFEDMDTVYPLDELHNIDEIIARAEHIDLEKSLLTGSPVYVDGYVPNSSVPNTSETSSSENPSEGNLDDLASAGAIPPSGTEETENNNVETTPNSDTPIATPEIQETKPLPDVEIENPSDGTPSEDKRDPIEIVGDKIGVDTRPSTPKEAFANLFDGIWIYLVLIAIFGGIYLYMQKKKVDMHEERIENDSYDDSRIE